MWRLALLRDRTRLLLQGHVSYLVATCFLLSAIKFRTMRLIFRVTCDTFRLFDKFSHHFLSAAGWSPNSRHVLTTHTTLILSDIALNNMGFVSVQVGATELFSSHTFGILCFVFLLLSCLVCSQVFEPSEGHRWSSLPRPLVPPAYLWGLEQPSEPKISAKKQSRHAATLTPHAFLLVHHTLVTQCARLELDTLMCHQQRRCATIRNSLLWRRTKQRKRCMLTVHLTACGRRPSLDLRRSLSTKVGHGHGHWHTRTLIFVSPCCPQASCNMWISYHPCFPFRTSPEVINTLYLSTGFDRKQAVDQTTMHPFLNQGPSIVRQTRVLSLWSRFHSWFVRTRDTHLHFVVAT